MSRKPGRPGSGNEEKQKEIPAKNAVRIPTLNTHTYKNYLAHSQ